MERQTISDNARPYSQINKGYESLAQANTDGIYKLSVLVGGAHCAACIQKIEASMGKSLEVAKIFQDKIPHQEIIERQNTAKYVKAARLAHQGMAVSEIAAQVDLSMGEIEMIAKLNREQLQFSEEDLPEWAQDEQLANTTVAEDDFLKPLTNEASNFF